MSELLVITPSRQRPRQLAELALQVRRSAAGRVQVLACVDDDDPQIEVYRSLLDPQMKTTCSNLFIIFGPRRSLSGWTNWVALRGMAVEYPYLASFGDDHRPLTPGWDGRLIDAIRGLRGPGFAYGNDLCQGQAKPTAWVADTQAVQALGWMMLPTCEHLYVDDAVLALGKTADRIAYVPTVVIEHLHPVAGKADWDATYQESNSQDRYATDGEAFRRWRDDPEGLAMDAATLRGMRHPWARDGDELAANSQAPGRG